MYIYFIIFFRRINYISDIYTQHLNTIGIIVFFIKMFIYFAYDINYICVKQGHVGS